MKVLAAARFDARILGFFPTCQKQAEITVRFGGFRVPVLWLVIWGLTFLHTIPDYSAVDPIYLGSLDPFQ